MNFSLALFVVVSVVVFLWMLPTTNQIEPHANCDDPACYMTYDCGGFTQNDD